MAQDDYEGVKKLLQELEKSKFAKQCIDYWHEQAKMHMQTTLIIVAAVLITILLLNWGGKLTVESNGWIIAALLGYLFGRGQK